jgi:hypothetical protein
MQQRLNFRPLPQGQGWLRPGRSARGGRAVGMRGGGATAGLWVTVRGDAGARMGMARGVGGSGAGRTGLSGRRTRDRACSCQARACSRRIAVSASRKGAERCQLAIVLPWTPTDRAAAAAVEPAESRARARCWAGVRCWRRGRAMIEPPQLQRSTAGARGREARALSSWIYVRFLFMG